jgi:hypothetical protein
MSDKAVGSVMLDTRYWIQDVASAHETRSSIPAVIEHPASSIYALKLQRPD